MTTGGVDDVYGGQLRVTSQPSSSKDSSKVKPLALTEKKMTQHPPLTYEESYTN